MIIKDQPKDNMNLYLLSGFINPRRVLYSKASVVVCLGGRGIGKTYGCLKQLHEDKIPFIYMRRTQSQLDSVTIPALNPYNQICRDTGCSIICRRDGKYTVAFHDVHDDNVTDIEPFAIGIALSTFASIRGMSAERYKVLLFDEVLPERHEKKFKEEQSAFLNVLESLNRNRELAGEEPLKVVLLSNSNAINSQILDALGCVDVIDRMIKKNVMVKSMYNGDLEIIRYIDSPISERKKDTLLYRMTEGSEFQEMSIENKFSAADYEHVRSFPLGEYVPLVSIGSVTVYQHKTEYTYYVVPGVKARDRYEVTPLEKAEFKRRYSYLYSAMVSGRLYYSNVQVKISFENVWEV